MFKLLVILSIKGSKILKRKTNFSKKKKFSYILSAIIRKKNSFLAEVTFQEIFKLKLRITVQVMWNVG